MDPRIENSLARIEVAQAVIAAAVRDDDWEAAREGNAALNASLGDLGRLIAAAESSGEAAALGAAVDRLGKVLEGHERLTASLARERDLSSDELRRSRRSRAAANSYLDAAGQSE